MSEGLEHVYPHVSPVFVYTLSSTWKSEPGIASALYVRLYDREFLVTCKHVLNGSDFRYLHVPQTDERQAWNLPPTDYDIEMTAITWCDLAIFAAKGPVLRKNQKSPYGLEQSDALSHSLLSTKLGTSSLIYGTWGKMTHVEKHPGLTLIRPVPYAAKGSLEEVSNERIVARFNEYFVFEKNTRAFPELSDITASGGSRDLSGLSGSGLWLMAEERPILAGVLLGPLRTVGDPLLVFTPVWVLRQVLDRIIAATNGKQT